MFEDIYEIATQLFTWWLGGIGVASAIGIVVTILLLIGGYKVAKKVILQLYLVFITWIPSIIVAYAVDVSKLTPPPPIPLQGSVFLLFPYTWDVLLGYFNGTSLGTACLLMVGISYVTLFHFALMFAKKLHYRPIMSFVFAYLGLLTLGIGMFNTHAFLWNYYCGAVGAYIPPILPIIFIIVLICLVMFYAIKNKKFFFHKEDVVIA